VIPYEYFAQQCPTPHRKVRLETQKLRAAQGQPCSGPERATAHTYTKQMPASLSISLFHPIWRLDIFWCIFLGIIRLTILDRESENPQRARTKSVVVIIVPATRNTLIFRCVLLEPNTSVCPTRIPDFLSRYSSSPKAIKNIAVPNAHLIDFFVSCFIFISTFYSLSQSGFSMFSASIKICFLSSFFTGSICFSEQSQSATPAIRSRSCSSWVGSEPEGEPFTGIVL
jgi:hypothetical protein